MKRALFTLLALLPLLLSCTDDPLRLEDTDSNPIEGIWVQDDGYYPDIYEFTSDYRFYISYAEGGGYSDKEFQDTYEIYDNEIVFSNGRTWTYTVDDMYGERHLTLQTEDATLFFVAY